MADCEICGKPNAKKKAEIEGSILTVCEECAKLGIVKSSPSNSKVRTKKKKKEIIPESDKEIKRDYSDIVKDAREGMELKRKELAERLNIKESVLAKIERGDMKPSIKIAKKLEKKLNIGIITESPESEGSKKKEDS
ncbi:MAG: multiprotein bridging factor aMBF1, partial [Candidatus Aenigmatarchaeota archaeon]